MASGKKDILLGMIRNGLPMTLGQQIRLTILLSLPAIAAQISSVLMQYIDAGMVGQLGANQSASIGLVATTTWIMGGFQSGASSGFSVQVAHLCGAQDFKGARAVMRQGLTTVFLIGLVLAVIGVSISGALPHWLGGTPEINKDASEYFLIYSAFIPIGAVGWAANSMLQASGNMKIPSLMYTGMCGLDVVFNYIFIYICEMGVAGAALGTGAAQVVTSIFVIWYILRRSKELNIKGEQGTFIPRRKTVRNAWGITAPMWLQNIIMRGSHIMSTIIVAPLGPISIAANSLAIIAESFCYMPGYGIEEAATTLVGQSLGAKRKEVAKRFSQITMMMAAGIMTLLGALMFIFATDLMMLLSSDPDVIALGAKVLRIEAFAETPLCVLDRRLRFLRRRRRHPRAERDELRKHVGDTHRTGTDFDTSDGTRRLLGGDVHRAECPRIAVLLETAGREMDETKDHLRIWKRSSTRNSAERDRSTADTTFILRM